jgi:hypothetical protein
MANHTRLPTEATTASGPSAASMTICAWSPATTKTMDQIQEHPRTRSRHRPRRRPPRGPHRFAAAGRPRSQRGADLHRQRRHRLVGSNARRTTRQTSTTATRYTYCRCRCEGRSVRRSTGRGRSLFHGVDQRRPTPPPNLEGSPPGQGTRRGRSRATTLTGLNRAPNPGTNAR